MMSSCAEVTNYQLMLVCSHPLLTVLVFPVSTDTALPMQLQLLDLSRNQLVGTLLESWSNLTQVIYWINSVHCLLMSDQQSCKALIQSYMSTVQQHIPPQKLMTSICWLGNAKSQFDF